MPSNKLTDEEIQEINPFFVFNNAVNVPRQLPTTERTAGPLGFDSSDEDEDDEFSVPLATQSSRVPLRTKVQSSNEEEDKRKVWVGSIPRWTRQGQLAEAFGQFGPIKKVVTGDHCFAIMKFFSEKSAKFAIDACSDDDFLPACIPSLTRPILVRQYFPKASHDGLQQSASMEPPRATGNESADKENVNVGTSRDFSLLEEITPINWRHELWQLTKALKISAEMEEAKRR